MINMMMNMVSYVMCGVCEVALHDPVVVRDEPALQVFDRGLDDVDAHVRELNTLTHTVLARPVPLLTVDELCRMVELDVQIQQHR